MKRIISSIVCVASLFSLIGCNKKETKKEPEKISVSLNLYNFDQYLDVKATGRINGYLGILVVMSFAVTTSTRNYSYNFENARLTFNCGSHMVIISSTGQARDYWESNYLRIDAPTSIYVTTVSGRVWYYDYSN